MTTHTVRARRWKRGWELRIDGVGVTQARKLAQAEHMARDYIALELGISCDEVTVEIIPDRLR